jgi:hypothetical protein
MCVEIFLHEIWSSELGEHFHLFKLFFLPGARLLAVSKVAPSIGTSIISYHIIAWHRNTIEFLPEVWSPLQATVHLCGIFYLPWHRRSGTRDHGFWSHPTYLLCINNLFKFLYVPWPGSNPVADPFRIVSQAC